MSAHISKRCSVETRLGKIPHQRKIFGSEQLPLIFHTIFIQDRSKLDFSFIAELDGGQKILMGLAFVEANIRFRVLCENREDFWACYRPQLMDDIATILIETRYKL
jgi:hypothetical protein